MIDILCVTTKLQTGGVQTFLMNNVKPLLENGIRLNFIVQDSQPQRYDDYVRSLGCQIFPVTSLSESKLRYIRDIRKILKNNPQFKIIHDHQNFAGIYSLMAANALPVRICHAHGYYLPKSFFNKLVKKIFHIILPFFATNYWSCSLRSARWLYGKKYLSEKCEIIKNSINTTQFAYNSQKRNLIREQLKWENFEIWLNIGSLVEAKNQKFLIDLFYMYNKHYPKSRLLICGEGPLRSDLEKQIIDLNLRNKVLLLGDRKNVEEYLMASDLFLLTSVREGFPMTCVEAQASGITSIVSSAVPDECKINPNFFITKNLDLNAWIRKIELIKNNKFNREEGKTNIIEAGFDIESEAIRISNLYNKLYYNE